jgi:hypothetical protein
MIADKVDELFAMADKIGMARRWYQPLSHPHFDLSKTKRRQAVARGAIEVDRRELVRIMRETRKLWFDDPQERAKVEEAHRKIGRVRGRR